MHHIPLILIASRGVTGVMLVALAMCGVSGWILALLYLVAFIGDIADGMIARRLGISTISLRRLDTRADLLLLLGAVSAILIRQPALAVSWLPWIGGYVALYALRNAVDYARYRASPSYHMWSGKVWALLITLYLLVVLWGNDAQLLIPIAFIVYSINALEGIIASILLPRPMADIPTLWHACKIKKESQPSSYSPT